MKDKTRLLVTHSTQYLPDCDDIVVMDNGGIILAHGNLAELKAMKVIINGVLMYKCHINTPLSNRTNALNRLFR